MANMAVHDARSTPRWLFVATILAGSFLLFVMQPLVARSALPRLGGAPAVWNSAMLVYQLLLLAGYAYAHALARLPLRRQAIVHLAVLAAAGVSLPLALPDITGPVAGLEALWVPWLFLLAVGPAFFAISAQAPLLQNWYATDPAAPNPYPLYAASNLGSFAGLLAYPLLAEPLLPVRVQSTAWSVLYGALVVLVIGVAFGLRGRRPSAASPAERTEAVQEWPGRRRAALWLALAAIPSGLMLSTTTFLTTDIMAMPLLWVLPLGLYLLSYVIAFSRRRTLAQLLIWLAPAVLVVGGGLSMFAAGRANLLAALASIVLFFVVSGALHARLYDTRPGVSQLTGFYLVLALGGVLGGAFTALLAPIVFDWTWEHPILLLAAALVLPLENWKRLARPLIGRIGARPATRSMIVIVAVFALFNLALILYANMQGQAGLTGGQWALLLAVLAAGIALAGSRGGYVLGTAALLLGLGGIAQLQTSLSGERTRSYFGIYAETLRPGGDRVLMHGTTIHGVQRAGQHRLSPTAYFGETSGVGLALTHAGQTAGPDARVGIVGLGIGTLACYRQPGQEWTFFELDRAIDRYARGPRFSFIRECAPDARIQFGDARLSLAAAPPASFDIIVVDAFSSDAIPVHLLTVEAMAIYRRALSDGGIILLHISNRYVDLEPVIAALAQESGMPAMLLASDGDAVQKTYSATWVALAPDRTVLDRLSPTGPWRLLRQDDGPAWTDDYAPVLRHFVWENFL